MKEDLQHDTSKPIPRISAKKEEKYLLPPLAPAHQYTLVLDLDETLVHFQEVK